MRLKHNRWLLLFALLAMVTSLLSQVFAADTVTLQDGQIEIIDTATNMSESGGVVTVKARGGYSSQTTNTITIYNRSNSTATISFNYSASNYSSFSESSASGTKSETLQAGGSFTMYIKGKKAVISNTATLTLSNISITAAADSSNVTFIYDNTCGNVTIDDAAVAPNNPVAISSSGATLVASPNSGVAFLGWVNAKDGSILSTETTYTLVPAADMEVKVAFGQGGGIPWFGVGGTTQHYETVSGISRLNYYTVSVGYLFDNLTAANAAAVNSSAKNIVLMNSGTLPAGSYTISSGITLLIPFDSSNTLYTTMAQASVRGSGCAKPTAYRTLTMASGAHLTIEGAMSLSAKTCYSQGGDLNGGSPTGNVSFVTMAENSTITVAGGGSLYAWGYITGAGTVTANNGATIYECFQFMDGRGGTQLTDMENGVFPLSQYYVQNIEVPLTLEYGAEEYAFTTVYMSSQKVPFNVLFVGTTASDSGGMFRLSKGSATKYYDGSTDRLMFDLNGDVELANIEITVLLSSIDSADYALAINNNITVTMKTGSNATIKQDLAMLPGAEVIIEEGATCTLGSGYSVFVYDADQWGTYCGAANKTFIPLTHAPGRTYTRTASDLVDAKLQVDGTLDASASYIYTTEGGANICSAGTGVVKTQAGTQTVTYQLVQDTGYTEIPITPAKLKNGDGSYVQSGANTYTYCGECLQWLTSHGNATNVELGNSLNMYFAFWSSSITEDTKGSYYVIVTHTDADGKQTAQTLTSDLWWTTTIKISDTEEQPAYVVPYRGLAAKQMGDTVTVKLYKGNTAMHTWTDSIQNYAMRMLADHSDNTNLRTLLVDMLNYGAACQTHFGYNTANLANALLTDTQKAWATDEITIKDKSDGDKTYYNGSQLVTSGNIQFAVAFKGLSNDAVIEYSYKNHWNDGDDATKDALTWGTITYSGNVAYYISKLVVADARELITFEYGDKTWTDSIESYCARMIADGHDTNGVFTAFMKFADSAEAYLEGGSRV